MAALVPHVFEGRTLHSINIDGEPWFVASDVARMLEHRDANNLVRSLDDDERGTHVLPTLGGDQSKSVISEPGLYRAIVQRRATEAIAVEHRDRIARFQRWVFHDVLPSIRRTGSYETGAVSVSPAPPAKVAPPAVASTFKGYFSIGRLIGLDRNQSALAANRATIATTGVDPLGVMDATHLLAPVQEHLLTPTDIGRELGGLSGIAVNQRLADRGLQVGKRDAKDRAYWEPTELGRPHARFLDTGKRHGAGAPVLQLKWAASVLQVLQSEEDPVAALPSSGGDA